MHSLIMCPSAQAHVIVPYNSIRGLVTLKAIRIERKLSKLHHIKKVVEIAFATLY